MNLIPLADGLNVIVFRHVEDSLDGSTGIVEITRVGMNVYKWDYYVKKIGRDSVRQTEIFASNARTVAMLLEHLIEDKGLQCSTAWC